MHLTLRQTAMGAWRGLVNLLSSVWFGISMLVAIFLYLAVGSGLIVVRQHFELTEMEFFSSPVFVALLGLFCLSIITVTIRRIPLNRHKLGVWAVHCGLVVLAIGCYLYFSRKVEGTLLIFQRVVLAQAGSGPTVKLLPVLGSRDARATLEGAEGTYELEVVAVEPDRVVTGAEGDKRTDWVVMVRVRRGPDQWLRILHGENPQLDRTMAVPFGQEAEQASAPELPGELRIRLATDPRKYFYQVNTAALYVKLPGREDEVELPVTGLPRYHEYTGRLPVDYVGKEVSNHGAIDIPLSANGGARPGGLRFRVRGFLPYAVPADWMNDPNGPERPAAFTSMTVRGRREFPVLDTARGGAVFDDRLGLALEFSWKADADAVADRLRTVRPELLVEVPAKGIRQSWPLADLQEPRAVGDSKYRVRLTGTVGSRSAGRPAPTAMLEIQTADTVFTRAVFPGEAVPAIDFDSTSQRPPEHGRLLDEGITAKLVGAVVPAAALVADAGLGALWLVTRDAFGGVRTRRLGLSQAVELSLFGFDNDTSFRCFRIFRHARPAPWAQIVPRSVRQRLSEVGASYNMIYLQISKGTWTGSAWLTRQEYIHLAEPLYVKVPGIGAVGLVFGPHRVPLDSSVELLDFEHKTDPTGQVTRDFVSYLRLTDRRTGRVRQAKTFLNHPLQDGRWHYFQSRWDKDTQSHTGLLVTNRRGIAVMGTGIILMILGMIYTFYVKPLLAARVRAGAAPTALREVER